MRIKLFWPTTAGNVTACSARCAQRDIDAWGEQDIVLTGPPRAVQVPDFIAIPQCWGCQQ